jgi:chromosome segregation ATPase
MMQEMKAKGEAEKEKEAKLYEEYMTWCKDTGVSKAQSIETATNKIESLKATIQKHEAAATELKDAVAALDGDISGWQSDHEKITEIRETEKADYDETHTDYSESIDALTRAIVAVQKTSTQKLSQLQSSFAFVQKKLAEAKKAPASAKPLIASLLQKARQDPYAYESKSGGVVDLLEDLKEKFLDELHKLETEEMETAHAYDMEALTLTDSIKYAEKERATKATQLAEHEAAAGEAKGTLAQTMAEKAADEEYVADLKTQCMLKSEAFESRQAARADELAAIEKAIEIISSAAVSGASDKYLPALVQKKAHSFGLRRSAAKSSAQAALRTRVAALLHSRGALLGSKELVLLATRVSEDPFAKVIKMIKGLIAKLEEEAAAEADKKQWCDGELKENKLTREAKTAEVESITAAVDMLKATISKLSTSITEHSEKLVSLDAAMKVATEVRHKEKAENEETVADATAALEAVTLATKVLKEYYAKAAPAMLQQSPAFDEPESFSNDAYTGMQGAKKGVLGLLEVIHTDFSRVKSDTEVEEAQASKEYDTFMEESAKDKEVTYANRLAMQRERTAKERDLASTEEDLQATQGELDAALAYYAKLKPDCIADGLSYEERKQMRQEELDSLNEAYKILDGDLSD